MPGVGGGAINLFQEVDGISICSCLFRRHGARSVEFAPSRSNQGRFVFYNDLKVRNLMHHHDDLLVDSSMIVPLLDLGCILLGTIPERDCTEEKQDAFFFWVTFQSQVH